MCDPDELLVLWDEALTEENEEKMKTMDRKLRAKGGAPPGNTNASNVASTLQNIH